MPKPILAFYILKFTFLLVSVKVTAQPTIASFSPISGPVGTIVTITGTNFNAGPANNIVYFGAVRATVTTGTTTSLAVSAPAGATYQSISVLDNATGLTAYSSKPFITTFTNPFGTGIPANFYKPKVDFVTSSSPHFVAFGDVDGDGKPDLVVTNTGSNTISVLRNVSASGSISASSFAAKVDFITGATPVSVAIGDVDGDGKPDLVVANQSSNTLSVLRNTSTSGSINASSFAAKVDFITDATPASVAIGDVDGDGKPDLMVANYGSHTISVLRNVSSSGSISASSFVAKVDFITGSFPRSVAIGDVDGDGKPDVVVVNGGSASISVLRNVSTPGTISASSFAPKVDFATGASPEFVAIGDLDVDGKPDLVVANDLSYTLSVLHNTSTSGSINASSFATKIDFVTGSNPRSVAIGDVDGDGKPDLVVAIFSSSTISVFRNTSTPGSISASSFATKVDFTTGAGTVSVAIGDVNGDGIPEVAAANFNSNTVSVFQISATLITNHFRTKATGNWNDVNTWESSPDNIIWNPVTLTPNFNSGTITILNTHTVTVTVNLTIDQTILNSGASVVVNPGANVIFNDGPGIDLTLNPGSSFIFN